MSTQDQKHTIKIISYGRRLDGKEGITGIITADYTTADLTGCLVDNFKSSDFTILASSDLDTALCELSTYKANLPAQSPKAERITQLIKAFYRFKTIGRAEELEAQAQKLAFLVDNPDQGKADKIMAQAQELFIQAENQK